MINKEFGMKVASLRKERGMTQASLAEKLNVSNKAVSRWETGEGYPDITLLLPLAEALEVSADYLLSSEKSVPEDGNIEKKHRKIWNRLTIYNKVSFITLAIIAGISALLVLFMFLYISNDKLVMWFPFIALIGSVLIKIVPVVGVGSALIGIVAGSIGKEEKQSKPALILIALNILFPILWLLLLFVAV